MTPGANYSTTTINTFQYEMWRPLYWYGNGVRPVVVPSMSLADPPVYSNGDKTVTVHMKTNYRWSDGQPVTSKDALFYLDMVRAAVQESGANWGSYTPHLGIPDQVVSASTPNASTLVLNLNKPVNPQWFTADGLYYIQPIPAHAWARAAAGGPILDFTNPANAKKIYDYLAKQSGSTSTYATNPLWQVVDGPYRLTQFNNTTGGYTLTPNPKYDGPHSKIVPTVQAVPYTSDTAEFNAVLSHSVDLGYMPLNDVPQLERGQGGGVPRLRLPRLGIRLRELQLRRQDRRLQQHHQAALHPAGPGAPGKPGGLHQGLLPRRRRPRVRADSLGAHLAVHSRERAEEPVPVQRRHGGQPAEVARLERGARRPSTCAKPGTGAR